MIVVKLNCFDGVLFVDCGDFGVGNDFDFGVCFDVFVKICGYVFVEVIVVNYDFDVMCGVCEKYGCLFS